MIDKLLTAYEMVCRQYDKKVKEIGQLEEVNKFRSKIRWNSLYRSPMEYKKEGVNGDA